MGRVAVCITGADGFIGKNLIVRLQELGRFQILPVVRSSSEAEWREAISAANVVVHLAGVNRPQDPAQFRRNEEVANLLASTTEAASRAVPVIYASSAKATDPTPYGLSKKAAENALLRMSQRTNTSVAIFRLPNVFGKWCRPDYNSAVATFCHNIAHGLPIAINDADSPLTLVYIDDVIDAFIAQIESLAFATGFYEVEPSYETTVGAVADLIRSFRADRNENLIADVGLGFTRALYATYISYLPVGEFSYEIPSYRDPRGAFSEMLKTRTAGQFSYFNALPGVTRGGHYHHTKTEKFLVVYGEALFRFRQVLTGETHEIRVSADKPAVVETIPGWAHDITNIGNTVMVSMLWANEIFDRSRPDTIASKV